MLEVGKLYTSEEYFLLLFPDPDTAYAEHAAHVAGRIEADAYWSAYLSNRFGKPVFYIKKNVPLLVLNNEEKFYEVLAGDRKGWIIDQDWLKIREIP